ncbi:MAG TPA: FAD-binding oxidoreductase, partial [Dehalococcoidia bacterium]|nr:FAD-binding oxidoreductase [Dehalococcoidia bacterium]
MGRADAVEDALLDILGREGLVTGQAVAAYSLGGLVPRAVARPCTVEQVQGVLGLAHREGLAVVPWGGGTMMGLGPPPRRYDIALDMRRLDRVLEHEPADLTCTVQAGMTVAALLSHLAGSGQSVGLDPPLPQEATVGGTLAAAVAGPRRYSCGHPRDFTIGMRVVLADGRLTRAGGRVVKNVAGYDLCKLYIGSMGTLGVVVEATFKLLPLPRTTGSLRFAFARPEAAYQVSREVWRRGLSVTAMWLQWERGPYVLFLELGGSPAAVARSEAEARELAAAAGGTPIDDAASRWQEAMASPAGGDALAIRLSLVPSRLPEALRRLEGLGPRLAVAFPTIGSAYVCWSPTADARSVAGQAFRVAQALEGVAVVHAWPSLS